MPPHHAPAKKKAPHHGPAARHARHENGGRLKLDEKALEAARHSLDDGAVTPHSDGPWVQDVIELLNGSLATELVCILRYKRHYFTARRRESPTIADEFLVHANEEQAHAERIAVEACSQMIDLVGDKDPTTRRMLEEILADEQEHADELSDWL